MHHPPSPPPPQEIEDLEHRPRRLKLGGWQQAWTYFIPVFTVTEEELLDTAGLDAMVGRRGRGLGAWEEGEGSVRASLLMVKGGWRFPPYSLKVRPLRPPPPPAPPREGAPS